MSPENDEPGATDPAAETISDALATAGRQRRLFSRTRAPEDSASAFADAASFEITPGPLLRSPQESVNAPAPPIPAAQRRRKRRPAASRRPPVKTAVFALVALALIAALGWSVLGPRRMPGPAARTGLGTRRVPDEDYEMGLNLWNGMGRVRIDQSKAVAHFRAAAANGCSPAQAFLAMVYQEGLAGVERDEFQAAKWAKMSLAAGLPDEAQQGDAEAELRLGYLYDKGAGVTKDPAQAVELYKKAADQGNASAQYSLGVCFLNGDGVGQDLAKAVSLYQKSADQGNAFAQNDLGVCCQIGAGVAQDVDKAVSLYKKAAGQGDPVAQKNLGVCYFTGTSVEKDLAKAVELYRKAADQGNAIAEFNLGLCYETGAGVQKDLSKAINLYEKAADRGDDSAQSSLGLCYEKGIGVEKDRDKAIAFYIKAADQGNAVAQERLRSLLHEGRK